MNQPLPKPQPIEALRIALGVLGALAGVSVVVLMLWMLTSSQLTTPQVAGALTDQQRYDMLAKARADDRQTLDGYGWVNREKGIVRIPIDLAMEKLLQEKGR